MRKRRLLWQLYPAFLVLTVAAIGLALWIAYGSLKTFYLNRTAEALEAAARLFSTQFPAGVETGPPPDSLLKSAGALARLRLTLILPDGRVAGDSHEDPARMENHGRRPEVAAALAGRTGSDIRLSRTLHTSMMYVAVPLVREGRPAAVLRAALPLASVDKPLGALLLKFLWAGLALALILGLAAFAVSRKLARPLEEMRRAAGRFAAGEFRARMPASSTLEISALADAVNQMAEELDRRVKTIGRQRGELEAIFGSMDEGVVAVDGDERIFALNRAAAGLFSVSPAEAQGKKTYEVLRNPALLELLTAVIGERSPQEREIVLLGAPERHLLVRGTPLTGAEGRPLGAVVVMNDQTRIKKLENLRQEFVANVSHELKTPITAVKGFLETLLDGALDAKDEARKFVEIAFQQTQRLNTLIEDLLNLSRLEQSAESGRIELSRLPLLPVLKNAAELCEGEARKRGLSIEIDCPAELEASLNGPLLEQAILNLLDNAVKYSGAKAPLRLWAQKSEGGAVVRVEDKGVGIEAAHLPRLFERFYRVDKSRSSKLGGTGLGLSIVKHIALAHGGRVEVESTPGEGSTFSIFLKG